MFAQKEVNNDDIWIIFYPRELSSATSAKDYRQVTCALRRNLRVHQRSDPTMILSETKDITLSPFGLWNNLCDTLDQFTRLCVPFLTLLFFKGEYGRALTPARFREHLEADSRCYWIDIGKMIYAT
ncbi:MAG: hypothetical protein CMJ78_03985 [Planctomycetaceae bacterium]|nr:hypothetical protein [Planctomycetaceae bacterium]